MKRNQALLVIAGFVMSGFILALNVSSQCLGPRDVTTKIDGKAAEEISGHLSAQAKLDIQKWDGYFEKVQPGKTTLIELNHWFGNLRFDYDQVGSWAYIYDYTLPSKTVFVKHLISGPAANYYEYRFVLNRSRQFVERKEKGFVSIQPGKSTYNGPCLKPVIYFYPSKEQDISVRLHYAGEITVSYPAYDTRKNGWDIRAYPDGKIISKSDREEYSYVFWEGSPSAVTYDMSKGFVIEGNKSREFLRDTLRKMGLTPREYNEFIVYWYPKLKDNKYNLIHFAHEEYTNLAKLEISPKPDSLLRVFMVYQPLNERIEVQPQKIEPFTRSGFTVVEWGGTELIKR